MRTTISVIVISCLLLGASQAVTATGKELAVALTAVESGLVDTASIVDATGLEVVATDLSIHVASGDGVFFEPIWIDSTPHSVAVYIRGRGMFRFSPRPKVEAGQLKRFFNSDSLNRPFDQLLLFLDDSSCSAVRAQLKVRSGKADRSLIRSALNFRQHALSRTGREQAYRIVRALTHPTGSATLVAYANLTDNEKHGVVYSFDLRDREEVTLGRQYGVTFAKYLENVCSYSSEATGIETSLNGFDKRFLMPLHYDLVSSISTKGEFTGSQRLHFKVLQSCRLSSFGLHPLLRVDSVCDALGRRLEFARYKYDGKTDFPQLYVMFDTLFHVGDTGSINVYDHGDIAKRDGGTYYVTAGAYWYPRDEYGSPTTFDMKFSTPSKKVFVATGVLSQADTAGDTVFSTWQVRQPTRNVSFDIGDLTKFTFTDTLAGTVDVYCRSAEYAASEVGREVSADAINAVRLLSHFFGKYPYDRLTLSEIVAWHGEAFPGFIHLGSPTWVRTDLWGSELLFRSHELAHQWWGVGVDYETYHDKWLSEGFAEYSSLMCLQAVSGSDKFLDKVKDLRKDVLSNRDKPTDSSAEAGPIILGNRTASTIATEGMSLMIYKKGALVLHMIRNMLMNWKTMNEDTFMALLREWYQEGRGVQRNTADFQHLVEKYTGEDMTWFFDEWVYGTEIPTYRFSYKVRPDGNNPFAVDGHVVTQGTSANFRMYVPVEIQFGGGRKAFVRVDIRNSDTTFTLAGLPAKPKSLKLNPYESVLAEVKQ